MALTDSHPEAEQLAQYVDGTLEVRDRSEIERHLAECADCRAVVAETMALMSAELAAPDVPTLGAMSSGRRRSVIGATAAFLAAAVLVLAIRVMRPGGLGVAHSTEQPELGELIAAMASEPGRPFDGRLTGGFKYAPPLSTRGLQADEVSPDVKIAAAKIEKSARENPSGASQAALGVSYLVLRRWGDSVVALEDAVQQEPGNTGFQSDLSAAYLARASQVGRASDWSKALSAADRAIQLDPRSNEPLFNRALALEGLKLRQQAEAAWGDADARVENGDWRAEIRQHLDALRRVPLSKAPVPLRDAMLTAVRNRDDEEVRRLVVQSPQQARQILEEDLLGAWGESVVNEEPVRTESLGESRRLAAAIRTVQGDSLADQSLEVIERAAAVGDRRTLIALAQAHKAYSEGRRLLTRQQFSRAQPFFDTAISNFRRGGSPFVGWAVLNAAVVDYQQQRVPMARARLKSIQVDPHSSPSLFGRVGWMTGLIAVGSAQYGEALREYDSAVEAYKSAHERANVALVANLKAQALRDLGDHEQTWTYHLEVLESLDALSPIDRYTVLLNVANTSRLEGLLEASRDFYDAVVDQARQTDRLPFLVESLGNHAEICYRLGLYLQARRELDEANALLPKIEDLTLAKVLSDGLASVKARVEVEINPSDAARAASTALESIDRQGLSRRRVPLLLARARAFRSVGNLAAAEEDLAKATNDLIEHRRNASATPYKDSLTDEEYDVIDQRIESLVANSKGDEAWQLLERFRSQRESDAPLSLSAVANSLPERVTLLYFKLSGNRLFVWVIRRDGWRLEQVEIDRGQLERMIQRFRFALTRRRSVEAVRDLGKALYTLTLAPARLTWSDVRVVAICADAELTRLPFSALIDPASDAFLIQKVGVTGTPSARELLDAMHADQRQRQQNWSALLVGDPQPAPQELSLPALTSARQEIANIAAIYSPVFVKVGEDATVDAFRGLAGRATVVHFAGHVLLNERYPMLSRLIFAQADRRDSMLLAGDLASLALSGVRLVVLAACRTGEGTTSRSAGVNSVARPLLRAGVPAVVGTLWEIEDAGSPGIMTEFHRRFRHGEGVVESLRQAQLTALGGAAGRSSWEWAAFSVLGGI